MTTYIEPPGVQLIRSQSRWKRYPYHIKAGLQRGVGNVRRIRDAITTSAKVPVMPPVRIYDEIWFDPQDPSGNTLIEGHATFWKAGDSFCSGVGLAATTPLSDDEDVIRSVLVHEFSHCFFFMRQVVRGFVPGSDSVSFGGNNVISEADDRALMVDPREWFSNEDADRFAHWHDVRLLATKRRMAELKLDQHLPRKPFQDEPFLVTTVGVPEEIVNHIQALDGQRDPL
jgi:hypothetical protein